MGSRIESSFSKELNNAKIVIPRAGGEPIELILTAEDIEDLVLALGDARMELKPAFPITMQPGDTVSAIFDYRWYVDAHKVGGKRIVSFRHPGLGWTSMMMPDGDAAELARWLTKDLPER